MNKIFKTSDPGEIKLTPAMMYRSKCRKVCKDSVHTAKCNLEVLQSQTIDPAPGLTQVEMISILKEVVQDWEERTEPWVKNARRSIKAKQS
ncbi:hypothetical protein SDC9_155934 [bioreactor metagenome]|uniref:Uncharacterized protein n=1 Tax=bioreactor metagenome TaxID=1076179 RepID=A0A645F5F0_9ZZZZ